MDTISLERFAQCLRKESSEVAIVSVSKSCQLEPGKKVQGGQGWLGSLNPVPCSHQGVHHVVLFIASILKLVGSFGHIQRWFKISFLVGYLLTSI